jgi:hypothetical protein
MSSKKPLLSLEETRAKAAADVAARIAAAQEKIRMQQTPGKKTPGRAGAATAKTANAASPKKRSRSTRGSVSRADSDDNDDNDEDVMANDAASKASSEEKAPPK